MLLYIFNLLQFTGIMVALYIMMHVTNYLVNYIWTGINDYLED